MDETMRKFSPTELNHIFNRFASQHVEEFYSAYQYWLVQQQIANVKASIEQVRVEMIENLLQTQQAQPSALTLASLARLQSKGVNSLALLDRMLERGEAWLDLTMERLERCEQLGFIQNNYTEWCQHALEDAYDWIDSMDTSGSASALTTQTPGESVSNPRAQSEPANAAAAELFLARLASADAQTFSDITLKMRAVPPTPLAPPIEDTPDEAPNLPIESTPDASPTPPIGATSGELSTPPVGAPFMAPTGPGGADAATTAPDSPTISVSHTADTPDAIYDSSPTMTAPPLTDDEMSSSPVEAPAVEEEITSDAQPPLSNATIPVAEHFEEAAMPVAEDSQQETSVEKTEVHGLDIHPFPTLAATTQQEERQRMLPAVIQQKPPLSYILPRLPLLLLRKIITRK